MTASVKADIDYSKLEAGRFELDNAVFDLHEVIKSVGNELQLRAREKGVLGAVNVGMSFPRFVKGDALRLVIIEKLPFASPDDALTRARIEHLKSTGGNAFREYQLPEAALALKQGVGRLIRSETDRGVVVICDPRIVDKPYGRVFRASLPPMPVTRVAADAEKFLRRIAGTTAPAGAWVREPEPSPLA